MKNRRSRDSKLLSIRKWLATTLKLFSDRATLYLDTTSWKELTESGSVIVACTVLQVSPSRITTNPQPMTLIFKATHPGPVPQPARPRLQLGTDPPPLRRRPRRRLDEDEPGCLLGRGHRQTLHMAPSPPRRRLLHRHRLRRGQGPRLHRHHGHRDRPSAGDARPPGRRVPLLLGLPRPGLRVR